jgi:DNA-binding GntR family transcriptional regulator
LSQREIANAIRARVDAGEWKVGEQVPTTEEFAAEYGVSEATAYRALALLVYAGVLRGEGGRGRFVADRTAK